MELFKLHLDSQVLRIPFQDVSGTASVCCDFFKFYKTCLFQLRGLPDQQRWKSISDKVQWGSKAEVELEAVIKISFRFIGKKIFMWCKLQRQRVDRIHDETNLSKKNK